MKKDVFISIVSHKQEDLIIENFKNLNLQNDRYNIKLVFIDNTNSNKLEEFALKNKQIYFADEKTRGFGENHNKAFEISKASKDDLFIVCNPDVILEKDQLLGMLDKFISQNNEFGNVTCYYDKDKTVLSNPDRHFPCLFNFVFSIALGKRHHYGQNENVSSPQWISGEFMIIKAEVYDKINGFDEDYFMYVEDIDLCYRANKQGVKITHDTDHYIIHETQMASRKIISKSFQMHLTSVFRFLFKHKRFCLLKKV